MFWSGDVFFGRPRGRLVMARSAMRAAPEVSIGDHPGMDGGSAGPAAADGGGINDVLDTGVAAAEDGGGTDDGLGTGELAVEDADGTDDGLGTMSAVGATGTGG